MQLKYVRVLEAARRVQGFLDSLNATIGSLVPAGLRAELNDLVARISAFQIEQESASKTARGETVSLARRRADLLERFAKPVARIAERKLRDQPDFEALIVPLSIVRMSDVVTRITTMVDAAANHEAVFIAGGLPTDFVGQVRQSVAALNAAIETRGRHRGRVAAATTGTTEGSKSLREIIAHLDAILRPVLAADPTLLADWDSSKLVVQTVVQPLPTGSLSQDSGNGEIQPTAGEAPQTEPALTVVKAAA
jgi:hypothetical protein